MATSMSLHANVLGSRRQQHCLDDVAGLPAVFQAKLCHKCPKMATNLTLTLRWLHAAKRCEQLVHFYFPLCSCLSLYCASILAFVLLAVSQNMRQKFTARGSRCVYVMPKCATVTEKRGIQIKRYNGSRVH